MINKALPLTHLFIVNRLEKGEFMDTNLSTLIEAIDVFSNFSGEYSALRETIVEYAEKARDLIYDLSQVMDELCTALEELPE